MITTNKKHKNMKKILLIALLSPFIFHLSPSYAQRPHPEEPGRPGLEKRPEITELVSDLSSSQKSKLETISKDSRKRVESLRNQQKAVRDSIDKYMEMDGDQSKVLYPLFDRESRLHAQISREMYATKVRIDKVLTKEQRKDLKNKCKHHQKQRKGKKH